MTPPLPYRVCAQPGCPTITPHPRCPAHTREASTAPARKAGYAQHRRERDKAKAEAIRTRALCPRCGQPILPGQALDYGHTVDLAADSTSKADRVEHRYCNRSAGGRTGQQAGTPGG